MNYIGFLRNIQKGNELALFKYSHSASINDVMVTSFRVRQDVVAVSLSLELVKTSRNF